MTAELLGWISALQVYANALVMRMRGLPPREHSLRAVSSGRHHFSRHFAPHPARGFTLTELMVAVTIVGVLSAAAAPSLIGMIAAQRVKTTTFDLYAALAYARSEAIKRNSVVTVTPHGGNFAYGYDLTAGGVVLRSEVGSPTVTINAPEIPLAFNSYGRLTTAAQYQLELTSAQDSSVAKRCLVVSSGGRASIRVDSDHDGNCLNG